jgi:F0F1-type ATP synthase assembly protein I
MQKYENKGRDQINIQNVGQFNASPYVPRDPVLVTRLRLVQKEVKERLAQSLHRAVDAELLNLGKVLEPHQVRNRWIMEEKSIQTHPPTPLPPEMTIAEVFELPEVGQELLILGEPGSGKTTTLLELTQKLVERALEDTNAPIPVLVNLSSWKDPQQKIFDWLLEELKSKYGLRQELGGQFLRQNQLLPCLDGLNEVAPINQDACAVKLNEWLVGNAEQRSMGVVVCCRREQYEKIVRKLFLENCVALQPLSDAQIEAYLNQFQLGTVWESVQASPQLQDLLRKPLFLAVFGFVAPRFDFKEWQQRATDDERMEYLFDRYWDVAMEQALVDAKSQDEGILSKTYGKKKLPDRRKVRRALVFAAKAMEQESQTELLIEKMQPTWLRNKYQQPQYRLIFGLITGLIVGVILGLFFAVIFGLLHGLILGLISATFWGISSGIFIGLEPIEAIEEISIEQITRQNFFRNQKSHLIPWLVSGPLFFLTTWLIYGPLFSRSAGPKIMLIFWLIAGPVLLLIRGLTKEIDIRDRPNHGIRNTCRNMIILTMASIFISIVLKYPIERLLAKLLPNSQIIGTEIVILLALIGSSFYFGGGKALAQHIALRIVLAWNGYAPYRYDKLLDYCTERLLLQRIGGRYRFMHKLLQEHFAKMPLD